MYELKRIIWMHKSLDLMLRFLKVSVQIWFWKWSKICYENLCVKRYGKDVVWKRGIDAHILNIKTLFFRAHPLLILLFLPLKNFPESMSRVLRGFLRLVENKLRSFSLVLRCFGKRPLNQQKIDTHTSTPRLFHSITTDSD